MRLPRSVIGTFAALFWLTLFGFTAHAVSPAADPLAATVAVHP